MPLFQVILDQDDYVQPLIAQAFSAFFQKKSFTYISQQPSHLNISTPLVQIQQYEDINFDRHLQNPATSLANSYVIRKAMIRKNHLWHTVNTWNIKHPEDTILKDHVPLTVDFELDYAEYLDEALAECWELGESFAKPTREWWVLKPAMSEQGQGIRMFSSEAELQAIFEEWEEDILSDEEDEALIDEADTPIAVNGIDRIGAGTMTSQLRHFVAQKYIERPLLFPEHEFRKFHVRTYVLAVGSLKVYVFKEMLALFAPLPYVPPGEGEIDLRIHLTNTCLQDGKPTDGSVHRFRDLPDSHASLSKEWKSNVCRQIEETTSKLFEAAAREQMIHFQTLPNSFEVFGVDWLVDGNATAWLLEVNAFPDFKQSGASLNSLVGGFWKGIVRHAVKPFLGLSTAEGEDNDMVKVLDIDLGR